MRAGRAGSRGRGVREPHVFGGLTNDTIGATLNSHVCFPRLLDKVSAVALVLGAGCVGATPGSQLGCGLPIPAEEKRREASGEKKTF